MPIIYLSPSTQEKNLYVTGTGSEEDWMNRLADAMIPYLKSSGIRYTRNTPDMTAGSSIRQANQG
ncbi:MAG: peptidoglycan hydrolase, partial [Oscillospiraceae bacterium]|nr:peptidoglycan hydrolase [Oscillospiraceae bacterium]